MHGCKKKCTVSYPVYTSLSKKRTVLLKLNRLFILRRVSLQFVMRCPEGHRNFFCLLCLRTLPSYFILSVAVNFMTHGVLSFFLSFFLYFFLLYYDFFYTFTVSVMIVDTPHHTQRHTHTLGRTPLDAGSARRIDLYLTTHNTHNRQTSIRPPGF